MSCCCATLARNRSGLGQRTEAQMAVRWGGGTERSRPFSSALRLKRLCVGSGDSQPVLSSPPYITTSDKGPVL